MPVAFGVTVMLPDAVEVESERLLPVSVTEDAFVVFHESVLEEPRVVLVGDAAKEAMEGALPVALTTFAASNAISPTVGWAYAGVMVKVAATDPAAV